MEDKKNFDKAEVQEELLERLENIRLLKMAESRANDKGTSFEKFVEEEGFSMEELEELSESVEFGNDFPDGRLTEVSDGKKYEWKKMIDMVRSLGRPLTEKESEQFRIK